MTKTPLSLLIFFFGLFLVASRCVAEPSSLNGASEVVNIWPQGARIDENHSEAAPVNLYLFLPDPAKATGQGVVVCPGGGYSTLCIVPEGYQIAQWLNEHGIAGFVLEYRLPAGRSYVPLHDAQRAIRTIRMNAKQWNIRPDQIGIIGFSAGGHLASTAATHFDEGDSQADNLIDRFSCRPDFAILVYPVICFDRETHGGTKKNLIGTEPSEEMLMLFSNEKQVSTQTPPTFLTHALDDKVVPSSNSQRYTDQMRRFHRPVCYVELEYGGHGLQGYKGPMWDKWQSECIKWLGELRHQ